MISDPFPGLVINYSYLWHREYQEGREEGVKDRPCAIVLSKRLSEGETKVLVAPITHLPPEDGSVAVEIPLKVKAHLGLDAERSWVICSEVNSFIWPGPDVRPVQGHPKGDVVYGVLPPKLFKTVTNKLLNVIVKQVKRTV